MTEIQLVKENGGLKPVGDEAYRFLGKIKSEITLVCDIKDQRRRSTKLHNFLFAILNIAYENQSYFRTFDSFRSVLLISLGYCEIHKTKRVDDKFKRLKESNDIFRKLAELNTLSLEARTMISEQMGRNAAVLINPHSEVAIAKSMAAKSMSDDVYLQLTEDTLDWIEKNIGISREEIRIEAQKRIRRSQTGETT